MAKSADAFRTISEVADWLETPAHVLRFWESKFSQVKPVKRAGGRRYYRPADMKLLGGIKKLLHDDGMTIKGVQKILREQGVRYVSDLSQPLGDAADDIVIDRSSDIQADDQPAPVLGFQRRAAADKEPATDTATEPDEPAEAEPSLPTFMHRGEKAAAPDDAADTATSPEPRETPQEEPPAPPRPMPAKIDVPDDPPDSIDAEPGLLSRLAGLSRPVSTGTAEQLAPLLARLRAAAGAPRKD